MSTLYVDNLQPNLGSQVEIPDLKPLAGTAINTHVVHNAGGQATSNGSWNDITDATFTYTPKASNSKLYIELVAHFYVNDAGVTWHNGAVRTLVNGVQASVPQFASVNFGVATYTDRLMGYAINLSEYNVSSLSPLTIKGQYQQTYGSASLYVNYYGVGHVRVTEIAQ